MQLNIFYSKLKTTNIPTRLLIGVFTLQPIVAALKFLKIRNTRLQENEIFEEAQSLIEGKRLFFKFFAHIYEKKLCVFF